MTDRTDAANSITMRVSRAGALLATLLLSFAAAPAAESEKALPPRTIVFSREVPRDPTFGLPSPQFGYFTKRFLPAETPEAQNRGAFVCSKKGGKATYLQGSVCFHRDLIFRGARSTEAGIRYYLFEQVPVGEEKKRNWVFEANPNQQGNCTIYYQIDGGNYTLFQVADRTRLETSKK